MLLLYVWIICVILIVVQITLLISHLPMKYKLIPVCLTVFGAVISFAVLLIFEKTSGNYGIIDTLTWYFVFCFIWTAEVAVCWMIYGIVKLICRITCKL